MTSYDYEGSPRIRAGTFSAVDMTDSYAWESFPRQADQPPIVDWLEPIETSDVYKRFATLEVALDGSSGTFGGGEFVWLTPYVTPFMVEYLIQEFSNRAVTVMTFDRGYGWRTVNAWLQTIDPSEGRPEGTGYTGIPLRFVNAVDAPSGYSHTRGFSRGFSAPP